MGYSQTHRAFKIYTPLDFDQLLFYRMTGEEELGRPFRYELHLLSQDDSIAIDRLLGNPAHVSVDCTGGSASMDGERIFHGLVSRFGLIGYVGRLALYHAELRPWLWFLSRTADCRIFQDKSVPEIAAEIFNDNGFSDFEDLCTETYAPREYCVQYRESDLNFVSRLLEQEGIYYYFRHEKDKHTLVLIDSIASHEDCPVQGPLPYLTRDSAGDAPAREYIHQWEIEREVKPGVYVHTDFDFTKPRADLAGSCQVARAHPRAELEVFDYPGLAYESSQSDTYARTRIEEMQVGHEEARAATNCRRLATGYLFDLSGFPRSDQNRKYLLKAMSYRLEGNDYDTTTAAAPEIFQADFRAMESKEPFRPARITPKPTVQGPQTAIVVGRAEEEIWTDEYGRVKVQFHWDRYGRRDENSSCWIRCSHPWAGKRWGAISIPRIGQEVIVDFLEGDPDRPIITGRVYNRDTMPPYELPQGAVVSGTKSDTHKGSGYNELSMDDTAGQEKITIHAQYDMGTTVEHDDSQTVHNNRTIKVDGTHTETIDKDTKITITEGNYDHKVNTGKGTYYVKGEVKETYDNKQETTIANELVITSKGSHVHVTAATEIQLEVGASTLLMKSDGSIKLNGVDIAINGVSINVHGVSVTSQADADHNTKGAIVISEGAASNTVKGGMVMLNP